MCPARAVVIWPVTVKSPETGLGALVMLKCTVFEVPPPGAGFVTVTAGVPVEAIAAAGMAAVNCVELTNIVAGAVPLKLTVVAGTKFVPLIKSVKAVAPAMALFGEIEVIVGVGLELTDWSELPPQPRTKRAVTLARATTMTLIMIMTSGLQLRRLRRSGVSLASVSITIPRVSYLPHIEVAGHAFGIIGFGRVVAIPGSGRRSVLQSPASF